MPNKMIPFSYEIKITHSDFCCYGTVLITILIKIDAVEAFFDFILYFYYYGIKTHCVA